jgi:two-component sensor histidine kinase
MQQNLLMREMNPPPHRSSRALSPTTLTMPELSDDRTGASATTFVALLEAVVTPHASDGSPRFAIIGSDTPLSGSSLTSAALLLRELATNAAEHGALAVPGGGCASN